MGLHKVFIVCKCWYATKFKPTKHINEKQSSNVESLSLHRVISDLHLLKTMHLDAVVNRWTQVTGVFDLKQT